MERPFQAIQVGAGPRGEEWVKAIRQNPCVEGVAYVDTDPNTLRTFSKKYDIARERLFTSLKEAIHSHEADMLIDVTPPQFHGQVSGSAFEAGLHVLSEKPISDNLTVAKQLVQQAKQAGRTYMISQNYRFNPLPQALRQYIQEGTAGHVQAAVITFYNGMDFGTDNFRSSMDHPMTKDMSIHHFDLMRCCLGKDARSVYARSYNPSWSWYKGDAATMMLIDFGDILVNYHTSWCNIGQKISDWRIDGSKGSLITNGGLQLVRGSVWTDGIGVTAEKRESLPLPDMPLTDHHYALQEFLNALREKREPECSGEDNLKSIALVFASIASIERGESVYLDEILSQ